MTVVCPICGESGRTCGDSHMTRPPVTSALIKGEDPVAEPQEMKEYEYVVGHVPTTALLTEKMAKRLGAKPVGEAEAPDTGNIENNEAQRASTHSRELDDDGVNTTYPDGSTSADASNKARTARNRRPA